VRLVLLGDGDSPHLLKWARALAPQVELWAASSRGFAPGFDALVPAGRRLALGTRPDFDGGNAALLLQLPRLARWLHRVRPDWIHAHYLTSHGTLAWLATRLLGAPGRLVGSAWGSDVLVTPQRSALMRWTTRRVLRACALSTSDSQVMAQRMHELGAGEVMVFPFGLETLPPRPAATQAQCYARARWYISQPQSDSVAVSVLEALAQGCIPLLSDLPANHELVRCGDNGWLAQGDELPTVEQLQPLLERAEAIAAANHAWIAGHAMFAPCVARFLDRLRALDAEAGRP
jgi:glycosyltransferase involved in cell wall biosynthesis